MKQLSIFILLIIFSYSAYSQEFAKDDVTVLRKNSLEISGAVFTSGFAAEFRRQYHQTATKKKYWSIHIRNYKHPKEFKISNDQTASGLRSFVFGKTNYLFHFQFGFGNERLITDKENKGDVSVAFNYQFGPTIGVLKPYYLQVYHSFTSGGYDYIEYRYEVFDPNKHGSGNIFERAPFGYGIGESKVIAGLFARTGVSFDYGTEYDNIKAIEVGGGLDYYPFDVPVMAETKNSQLMLNLYVSLVYGRKW